MEDGGLRMEKRVEEVDGRGQLGRAAKCQQTEYAWFIPFCWRDWKEPRSHVFARASSAVCG